MKIDHHPIDFHGLIKGDGRARLVPAPNVVGHSLDHLIGTWDEKVLPPDRGKRTEGSRTRKVSPTPWTTSAPGPTHSA